MPKPAGFSVKPDLAAGLTFVDGEAFARHIDGLSAAIAALSSFEGVPFRPRPIVLGTLAERAQKRTRLRDEAAKSSETQAENAGLDTVQLALTNLMDLFQDAASQLKSRLLSGAKKRKAGTSKRPSVMTPPQVAKRLRVTADKVRHWITSGELKAFNAATGAGGRARWKISRGCPGGVSAETAAQKPTPPSRRPRKKPADVIDFF